MSEAFSRFKTWYSMQPRALRTLVAINVAFYAAWILLLSHVDLAAWFVRNHLALHTDFPTWLIEPWQLVTYGFIHLGRDIGGLLHIVFNMLWLFWVGKELEEMQGPQTFAAVYLLGALGGGLLAAAEGALSGGAVVHGASGAVLAILMAVAIKYPYRKVALIFLPPIRLLYLVLAFLAIDILFSAGTSVGAHLGGALVGFLFVKGEDRGMDLSSWTGIFFSSGGGRSSRASSSSRRPPRRPVAAGDAADEGDVGVLDRARGLFGSTKKGQPESRSRDLQREVDRILEKISEEGMDALSNDERETLRRASEGR